MTLSNRSRVLIGLIVLIEAVLIVAGLTYRQKVSRDFELVSEERFNTSAVLDIHIDQEFFPTSFESMETWGILAVSTGRVYGRVLKDAESGDEIGTATILEVAARDRGDPDRVKVLPLVVQFARLNDPGRNLMPWVLESASDLRPAGLNAGPDILSGEQVAQVFPRGTIWVFVPLTDLSREELGQLVEYKNYVGRYYGGDAYPGLAKLFKESPDRHALLGEASGPIFLLAIPDNLEE